MLRRTHLITSFYYGWLQSKHSSFSGSKYPRRTTKSTSPDILILRTSTACFSLSLATKEVMR